eukprot:TRINITY_DN11866_c0_g1_i1.p2 TRINITY_DN11866_c0_g1~~TRINITY_DN11866_c0_g1_i1.p2  ORF type:complete len:109 (+),score=7.45 TRINITY_DN11866_c0_g1_i1:137-463(+)
MLRSLVGSEMCIRDRYQRRVRGRRYRNEQSSKLWSAKDQTECYPRPAVCHNGGGAGECATRQNEPVPPHAASLFEQLRQRSSKGRGSPWVSGPSPCAGSHVSDAQVGP